MMLKKRHTMQIKVGHVTRIVEEELSPEGAADDNSRRSLEHEQEDEAFDCWYMSRKELMENSPSRKDGIDWKKETALRKSYSTFLQDLGKKLNVPQITIATAIVFCHRFYLRQSHAKNDRWTIATVCMFLAAKVEDTPRPLKDVILISYAIIHSEDPNAVQRIKQKEVYEQQKQLISLGERVVLTTIGFAFIVRHPYKPLIEVVKKFYVPETNLAQVAWNFVNDGLRTLLCFQFKPHHIAAAAIFLAAKFLKVKLPSNGDKVWWQELDVTPRQLEEVSNQMLELYELYEQNRVPTSEDSEVGGAGGGTGATVKTPASNEEQASNQVSSHSDPEHTSAENLEVRRRGTRNQSNDESEEVGSDITDHKTDFEIRDSQNSEQLPRKDNEGEVTNRSNCGTEQVTADDQSRADGTEEAAGRDSELREGLLRYSPSDVIKMIDKDKVKAALEKRRKERGKMALMKDVMDEDDLIERELEDGIELAVEDEKYEDDLIERELEDGIELAVEDEKYEDDLIERELEDGIELAIEDEKYEDDLIERELEDGIELAVRDEKNKERRQSLSIPDHDETGDVKHKGMKGQLQEFGNVDDAEEGKMVDDDASSLSNIRKRKMGTPPERQPAAKRRPDSE